MSWPATRWISEIPQYIEWWLLVRRWEWPISIIEITCFYGLFRFERLTVTLCHPAENFQVELSCEILIKYGGEEYKHVWMSAVLVVTSLSSAWNKKSMFKYFFSWLIQVRKYVLYLFNTWRSQKMNYDKQLMNCTYLC